VTHMAVDATNFRSNTMMRIRMANAYQMCLIFLAFQCGPRPILAQIYEPVATVDDGWPQGVHIRLPPSPIVYDGSVYLAILFRNASTSNYDVPPLSCAVVGVYDVGAKYRAVDLQVADTGPQMIEKLSLKPSVASSIPPGTEQMVRVPLDLSNINLRCDLVRMQVNVSMQRAQPYGFPKLPSAQFLFDCDGSTRRLTPLNRATMMMERASLELPTGGTIQLICIPPGQYEVGSGEEYETIAIPEGGEIKSVNCDGPCHVIALEKKLWIAETETTEDVWRVIMGELPGPPRGDGNLPVENVTYAAAQEFCRKLGEATGAVVRLPTEVEWEIACMAGETHDLINSSGWWAASADGESHPVAQLGPNSWGLFDMLGNVGEWCDFVCYPNAECRQRRVLATVRGGSWSSVPQSGRRRLFVRDPAQRADNVGFRVVVEKLSLRP